MRFAQALSMVLLLALCGCGGFFSKDTGGGGGGGSHTLYAAFSPQNNNGSLSGFTVGTAGALTNLNLTAPVGITPRAIAITPNNQFLYVANQAGTISAFSIASTGALTALANPPGVLGNPNALAIDPAGKFLYASNSSLANIAAFRIQSDGSLVAGNVQQLPGSNVPFDLAITPAGNFLYVANQSDTTIYQLGTDTAGNNTFTQVTCSGACTIPSQAVAVHPNGALLYVADGRSQIAAYSLNSSGVPTIIGAAITGLASPVSLALDSTGNFLLVATNGDGGLTSYNVLQNGALQKNTALAVGTNPVQVRVDPKTNTAFVANAGGNPDVAGVAVPTSGQLAKANNASIGGSANAVAVTH